jgi:hypothetical protein
MTLQITQEQFQFLLPLATEWAEKQEGIILQTGILLNEKQLQDAKSAGVIKPEKIRLLKVPYIPLPEHPALQKAAQATQLITPRTDGLTVRYGIFIKEQHFNNRQLLAHEFIHTSQYERFGGFMPFLQQYLMECITIGYPAAPMEQEAIIGAIKICNEN